MKGVWLSQSDGAMAMRLKMAVFIRDVRPTLKMKQKKCKNSIRSLYFVTEDLMSPDAVQTYKDQMVEEDTDGSAEIVENILGDITSMTGDSSSNDELTAAKLENLKARTQFINEKIEARKSELFSEWSERMFTVFSECFAKYKNALINLHLNGEQLNTLNEALDDALDSLSDNLNKVKSDYLNENIEE